MNIITYSDLHLEFGKDFCCPNAAPADVMILAGDVINLRSYAPLDRLLDSWDKPVLYVNGNHEYYTNQPMNADEADFTSWLVEHHPNVTVLLDNATTIAGVQFFGGTMWTDFADTDPQAMRAALPVMQDYRYIVLPDGKQLQPHDTIVLHNSFVAKLRAWFEQDLPGPRVVITHCAPVARLNSRYGDSPMTPAFNSLDMVEVINAYQPCLWVYGHTHECDDQTIGNTRIVSNQRGYPMRGGGFECHEFEPAGLPIKI